VTPWVKWLRRIGYRVRVSKTKELVLLSLDDEVAVDFLEAVGFSRVDRLCVSVRRDAL
jgi:hypothetical protein